MVKEGFGKLASLKEAIKITKENIKEVGSEKVSLNEALGRTLAENVSSDINVPDFQRSAMDGYAIIAENCFGCSENSPKKLKIIDSITAGVISSEEINSGECIRITTGAPLPDGANAVVMVEYTQEGGNNNYNNYNNNNNNNNNVEIRKAVAPEENVIKIGSDVKIGDFILEKGTTLRPHHIGILKAIGLNKVKVKEKPYISYFSTGNEIVQEGELEKGKVYDINSGTICSAIKEQGCDLEYLGVIGDNLDEIKQTITKAKANLIILSGGSSLGGEDFMVQAVDELGTVLVHGIAVKPGKPVLIGKIGEKVIIGLPGYPTSALSNFYIFVEKIIDNMLGRKSIRKTIERKLSRKVVSTIGRYQFLPVSIDNEFATPISKGSSSISTLSSSNGFVEIDENMEVIEKDETVEVNLI